MKGYITETGYMGYIPNKGYILFSCERDYMEYYNETFKGGNRDVN